MEKTITEVVGCHIADEYKVEVRDSAYAPLKRAVLQTPQQIRDQVGEKLSVKINFVPQMLTALAMELASEFVNHCRDYRVHAAKKHNRIMRKAVETYAEALFKYYGPEPMAAYKCYAERFMGEIATEMYLLRLKLSELVANQMPEVKDREVPILCCAICGVIAYIEWYDRKMDYVLEEKLGQSVKCKSNACLDVIKALAVTIAEENECKIDIDKDSQVSDWLNILGNKAVLLADKIFAEENVSKC